MSRAGMLEDWKQSILALADIFVQKSDVPGAESGSSPAERKSRSDWCCSMCVVESESQRGLSQRCTAPAGAGRLAKSQPAEGVAWNERGGTGSQGDSEESQDEEGGEDEDEGIEDMPYFDVADHMPAEEGQMQLSDDKTDRVCRPESNPLAGDSYRTRQGTLLQSSNANSAADRPKISLADPSWGLLPFSEPKPQVESHAAWKQMFGIIAPGRPIYVQEESDHDSSKDTTATPTQTVILKRNQKELQAVHRSTLKRLRKTIGKLEAKLEKHKQIDADAYHGQKRLLLTTNKQVMKMTMEDIVWKKKVCRCSSYPQDSVNTTPLLWTQNSCPSFLPF
jgi:hypothetical protein